MSSVLGRVTKFQQKNAYAVIGVMFFLTLAMLPGIFRLETVVALENMMPPESEPVEELNNLRAEGIGKDAIALEIEVGLSDDRPQSISDPELQKYIRDPQEDLQDIHGITSIQSPLRRDELVYEDRSVAVIALNSYMGDNGDRMERIFREIEEESSHNRPEGVETQVVGVPAVQSNLGDMVERDRNVTTGMAMIMVFLITLGLFRGSLSAALMPMIIVALSVVWLYGTMGYLGMPLSTLAGSVAALIIGIGIAYAIHIGNIYRFNRRDNTVEESLVESVEDIGTSIIASAITTISAFMAFLVGDMPEMHRFGLTMSMGIGYAVIFTIFFLPAVFTVEERLMKKIRESIQWRHDF